MSSIASVLGVARSHLYDRTKGSDRARGPYRKDDDAELLPLIRRLVDQRPTYGYRRITALANKKEMQKNHWVGKAQGL